MTLRISGSIVADVWQSGPLRVVVTLSKKGAESVARVRYIICPNGNCGYRGEPRRVVHGSTLILILLLLCFFPGGIAYLIFKGGYRYYCPQCGLQIGADI